jgi:hypothetical protein
MTRILLPVLCFWSALLGCGSSWAGAYGIAPYDAGNLNYLTSSWYYNAIQNQNLANSIDRNARDGRSSVDKPARTLSTTLPVASASRNAAMPAKMAATYPPAARPEAERVFRELLTKYPALMQQLGVKPNDLASSVATFVAGSWMAYRNTDLPDENFKPLVNQMRQIIGTNPEFAKASDAEKQEMHDQMAILGTFMATTQMALKETPNAQVAANMKQAAKGYLEQFLKTDAERVQITAQGLVLR